MNKLREWEEVEKELFSPDEIAIAKFKANVICQLVDARNSKKISQRQLEKLCGVKQPIISRIEKGVEIPRLDTFFKILLSLGKTIEIKDLDT